MIVLLTYLCNESIKFTEIIQEYVASFETFFYFSNNQSLSGSRVLTDGFLVDKGFSLEQSNLNDSSIKVALLQKISVDSTRSNDIVRIESNLHSSVFECLNSGNDTVFTRDFLDGLKQNGVKVLLSSEMISDVKKAQLNSISCSLVSFIDYKFIEFLSNSLKVKTLTSRCSSDEINNESVFNVNGIERFGNEKLLYFRYYF